MPFQVEFIHEAVAGAGDVIVLCIVLQCESNEQVVIEDLYVEGRIACRHMPIGKAIHLVEVLVEDIDRSIPEVCRVKEGAILGLSNRKTLVDGSGTALRVVNGQDRTAAVHVRIPAGNGAVLGCENE